MNEKDRINGFDPNIGTTVCAISEKDSRKIDMQTRSAVRLLPDGRRVNTPTSLRVGEGAQTVFEFDHGLPRLEYEWSKTEAHKMAGRRGAEGAITLRVVDSKGTPVEGARVGATFWNWSGKDYHTSALTEESGLVELSGTSVSDVVFGITKSGYYTTHLRYWFSKRGFDCVKDGRWLPWNPVLEVTLKEVRHPIKMVEGGDAMNSRRIPRNEDVGYDFMLGDFVEPIGKGKHADMVLFLESQWSSSFVHTNRLAIRGVGGGGFVTLKKDAYSEMKTAYTAPATGYADELVYEYRRTTDMILLDNKLQEDEYLAFKSPARGGGNSSEAHFGVISLLNFGGGWVQFRYTCNPTPNDRKLEAEGLHP